MSVAGELAVNKRNTARFIAARPSVIALTPITRVRTASGGTKVSDLPPRSAQTLRLIEQASAYGNNPGLLQAQDGKQLKVTYQLLGEFDAVMGVGDHWSEGGIKFEIAELLPFNGYERRGQVIQYGQ